MPVQGEPHVRVIQGLMRLFAPRTELLRVQMPLLVAVSVSTRAIARRKAFAYARGGVPAGRRPSPSCLRSERRRHRR
jgi:hypothetical protein